MPLLYFQALREERRPEARSGREEVPRFNEINLTRGRLDRQRFCCIAAMQMLQCSKHSHEAAFHFYEKLTAGTERIAVAVRNGS
ncbi:hypothetical protein [Rhizobium sp. C1]|uniref:hypothetical protein n=1 Tax=Rhizobium sp. C1 TaxID=1349799 RepID=UPI001E593AAB|nr:hypothetical protein [Rhizobium sp. C1]MCD2178762.1 hypothetical protein [Rhizobium sp. C1]